MTQALWEVLKDLWNFVCHEFSGLSHGAYSLNKNATVGVEPPRKIGSLLSRPIVASENKAGDLIGWTAYVQIDTVPYFSQPEFIFDTKLGSFSYGDKLMVICNVNNFSEVRTATARGWVDAKALAEDSHQVLPDLKPKIIYNAQHEQTVKLRQLIQDEALGQRLGLPLQSVEFVLSVLKRRQVLIPWLAERPRSPGRWKTLLKGLKGVTLSLEPHTGAILEYAGDDGVQGFLGYVEAVHPNLSITLQSVGREKEGEFRIEEFSHDEWKEWRPVFISFT